MGVVRSDVIQLHHSPQYNNINITLASKGVRLQASITGPSPSLKTDFLLYFLQTVTAVVGADTIPVQ